MSAPKNIQNIDNLPITTHQPLFTSCIKLFGLLPFDSSKLTLIQLNEGEGFIEESPMRTMNYWHHERKIIPLEQGCELVDNLIFEPRFFKSISKYFVQFLFTLRHKNLIKHLT